MKIGHQLKKARESNKLSQHEVSDLLGISQKTLSNIESNKSQPTVAQLALMGDIYKLDILKLLSENGIHLSPSRNLSEAEKELQNLKNALGRIIGK
ncbi:helix-turn-helix domain-containing protein [Algoriphagus sp. Y33]|uniref:helix-turn-helix domain-containing protein n=1 Tax=Algoriphagus sp. Y33 TaxID=2772483 RepID=UPI00177D9D9B|nr:helix-turn-helix transcriptional regulator [Algoriphagus sp. Y33]